jgi:hypothetical protein
MRLFFGRRGQHPRKADVAAATYGRRAVFERLEDRSLLSATLTLSELQMPIGSANVNVSK